MCRYNLSALSMCRGPQFWPLSTTLQPDRTRSYFLLQLQSAGLLTQRSVSPQTQWTSPNMDWQLRQTNNDWNTHNSYSNTHIGHKGDPVKIKHDKIFGHLWVPKVYEPQELAAEVFQVFSVHERCELMLLFYLKSSGIHQSLSLSD